METCTALDLHQAKCSLPATNTNNLFCNHHARQVQGLYLGYKRRSQELQALERKLPKFLPRNLNNADFTSINDPESLRVLHAYLLRRFNLTTRCVLAREYHHSNFYNDTSDFGHQAHLDRLRSSRTSDVQALHRLEKRMMDVSYRKTQWYAWVESLQTEADGKSEAEKKKVRAEAALFKKHQMNVNGFREEEESRQHSELEKADVWDPIELVIQTTRAGYIALIRLLVLTESIDKDETLLALQRGLELKRNTQRQLEGFEVDNMKRSRNRKAMRIGLERREGAMMGAKKLALKVTVENDEEADADAGEKPATDDVRCLLSGTNREECEAEIISQAKIIQEFILLRLIISNPSLLPAAMASPSIDAFLHNTASVRNTDLRDLGLGLSCPSLKLAKSACLDYWFAVAIQDQDKIASQAVVKAEKGKEKEEQTIEGPPQHLDPDRLALWKENKLKVCGKWIYNLPPEFTMPRSGWTQFSMMRSNCSLWDAISVCTSWLEFFDLNVLVMNGHFPNWFDATEPSLIRHLRVVGFVSYSELPNAAPATGSSQIGGRRGRFHKATQARNCICAHISRDDPGSWRFVNLLQSYTARVIVYVKDCLTGQVICAPPEHDKWLVRDKEGTGKLNKGKWVVRCSYDRAFKSKVEESRPWKLQFNDYLDIVVWDRLPGWEVDGLRIFLTKMLHKAHRYKDKLDSMGPTIDALCRTSAGKVGPRTSVHYAIAKSKLHAQGPQPSSEMYYDSIDEEIDNEYEPYEKNPRSCEEIKAGREKKEGEKEEDHNAGEVWEIAQLEDEALIKKAEFIAKADMLQLEPGSDITAAVAMCEQHHDRIVKFLKDLSTTRSNKNLRLANLLLEKDLTGAMDTFNSLCFRVGKILTKALWGEMDIGVQSIAMLQDVETRAQNPPPRRPPVCPQHLYAEWDRIKDVGGKIADFSREQERTIHVTLARLWKAGIIKPSWSLDGNNMVFAGRAVENGTCDIYIDYRHVIEMGALRPPREWDPLLEAPPTTRSLREEMEKFEIENPGATYSLIRIGSGPEYWNLVTTFEDSQRAAIIDPYCRIWEWARVPKDLPYSEWVCHMAVNELLATESLNELLATESVNELLATESEKRIGANIKNRIDTILVMGKDEMACKLWTVRVFALAYRLPTDLARSFVKVDAGFLRRLPEVWWE